MIRLRAQTCMDSKVVRADFGSGLICLRAQTCCAELRRLARLANSPGFKSIHCPRWRIKFSLERYSDYVTHSFAYPAAGKFSRASSAGGRLNLRSNIEQPDRVGRRGLSEPREDFSRLNTYAFPWLDSVAVSAANLGTLSISPTHALVSLRYFTRPGAVFSPSRRTRSSSYSEKFPLKKNV